MNNPPPAHHGVGFDRDRERELDEQRNRAIHQHQQQEEMAHREREREQRDLQRDAYPPPPPPPQQQPPPPQQQQPGPPHHSSAGSIPIHQPVASRIAGAIHSPNGLLANHGGGGGAPPLPANQLGGPPPPPGAVAGYGGPPPMHGAGPEGSRPHPSLQEHQQQQQQQQPPMYPVVPHGSSAMPPNGAIGPSGGPGPVFGGPLPPDGRSAQQPPPPYGGSGGMGPAHAGPPGPSGPPGPPGPPGPSGPGAVPQGQQPILNDALSYLDQVKVQFHEQPDVYNRFLDIMKDFKSQTIDTPGVISRVSDLFAGHPNLIQGFNTFLPPGYRIECGLENNPNSIRVTTPSGSTIHSIGASRNLPQDGPHAPPPGQSGMFLNPRPWPQQQQQVQHSVEAPDSQYGGQGQNLPPQGPGPYGPAGAGSAMYDNGPRGAHAGGPGGAAHPGPITSHPPAPRSTQTPAPGPTVNGGAAPQAAGEKRGPVEFNHAISYVNKIKNRFQDKPEIYKQFLEILQTYQREQKPIQEVYAQVTTLFSGAPDLLEDFKQFLPESAAHSRPAGSRPSEESPVASALAQTTPPGQTRDGGPKMPPVGNFAPPSSTSKESKKRPRQEKQTSAAVPAPVPTPAELAAASATSAVRGMPSATAAAAAGGAANKRAKLSHKTLDVVPAIEPTLTPVMPEPLAPSGVVQDTQEGLAFFERVKKYLPNRTTMNEFLKLINLYRLGLIELNVLVTKSHAFIGGNPELFGWFKSHLGYTGEDEIIENRPAPPSGKVSLSNCRGYGPSYRLLPRRERLKRCSGRDELCNSVLNDEWASHPTWASEDSGFVAHRKNGYEEGLHRIEEERHDYDFYIEANQKFIQLLEPLAQQMLTLAPAERDHFRMPPGLGGQSTSIYKRVLKKVYGADKGAEVANDMFAHPFAAVPVIMARLKQKDEEWRFSQREWEKVWMAQTEAMHLKSLDHMGIQVKSNDKRNLSAKHLVDVIKTKREEQRRAAAVGTQKSPSPVHQFLWDFSDRDVLLDLLRFMILYVLNSGQHGAAEKERITDFFESFVPQFFDLPEDLVLQRLADIDRDSGDDEGGEDAAAPAELTNGRTRRSAAASSKNNRADLLRGVLDPGRNTTGPSGSSSKSAAVARAQKEDSAASGSKETTPDVGSANEEEMPDAPPEDAANSSNNNNTGNGTAQQPSSERWLPTPPRPTVVSGANPLVGGGGDGATADEGTAENGETGETGSGNIIDELKADGLFKRQWYNFFCNQTIFVFFSVFHTLYKRLRDVKESTGSVIEELKRENAEKPGRALGMVQEPMAYFDEDHPETFWPHTVELIEDFLTGEIEESRYFDVLRHYYLRKGWTLYTIQDLLKTLCRQALVCSGSDAAREKTPDLVAQFLASRHRDTTSYQAEISARKFAEKCIKDGEMFQITWYPGDHSAAVRWLQRDEPTFDAGGMNARARWQYYISSYMRIEPTEGVQRARLRKSVLPRNLPPALSDGEGGNNNSGNNNDARSADGLGDNRKALAFHEGLVLRICLNSYAIVYEKGTSEYFIYNHEEEDADEEDDEEEEAEGGGGGEGDEKEGDDGREEEKKKGKSGADRALRAQRRRLERAKLRADQARRRGAARAQRFKEKFVFNSPWMKDLTQEAVRAQTAAFARWADDGVLPPGAAGATGATATDSNNTSIGTSKAKEGGAKSTPAPASLPAAAAAAAGSGGESEKGKGATAASSAAPAAGEGEGAGAMDTAE